MSNQSLDRVSDGLAVKRIELNGERREAAFSKCERYRYSLEIVWDRYNPRLCQFIGLNPSTADEMKDDPTLRRCKAFARAWGCGGIIMTNLFAYRATNPKDMKAMGADAAGEMNNAALRLVADRCKQIVCAWGNHGKFRGQSQFVAELLSGYYLECFRLTASGEPEHPLYMPGDQSLIRFFGPTKPL